MEFHFGNYHKLAWGYDEMRPRSGRARNNWGGCEGARGMAIWGDCSDLKTNGRRAIVWDKCECDECQN